MTTILKKKVRTYSANDAEVDMLTTLAAYHGFSKSGTITNLIKKEFWRVFPSGTEQVKPDPYAWVRPETDADSRCNGRGHRAPDPAPVSSGGSS